VRLGHERRDVAAGELADHLHVAVGDQALEVMAFRDDPVGPPSAMIVFSSGV
jgi:hypothetical protein